MNGLTPRAVSDARRPVVRDRASAAGLPEPTRLLIALVAGAGLACAGAGLALLTLEALPAVLLFLGLAVLASAVKLDLPLPGGGSTPSVSYVVTVAAVLVLGPWLAAPIAAASAWAQCNIRVKRPNAWYQSLFSVGPLALSVSAAGVLHNHPITQDALDTQG